MRVFDVGVTECAQSQMSHGTIVEDLGGRVRVLDGLLQMGHEHQVARLKPVIVQGMVVDVTENCSRAETIRVVLGVHVLAHFVHHVNTGHSVSRKFTLEIE